MMFKFMWLGVAIILVGCAAPVSKLDEQGRYRFAGQPFTLQAPTDCIAKLSVRDTDSSVSFTTGRNNWRADGDYRVEIYAVANAGDDRARFERVAQQAYLDTMASVGNRIVSAEFIEVNNRPAFQGVASDDSKAMVIGTNILFPEHIVMTQLLYPSKAGLNTTDHLPLACHQRFIESIEQQMPE